VTKIRKDQELLSNLGKAGQGASRGPGGPPYFRGYFGFYFGYLPAASRSARMGGRPASRIFFCAAAMSYGTRW
jgi:hypothetical protein